MNWVRRGVVGYFVHLPVTKTLLWGGFFCLGAFDIALGMAHSFSPKLFSAWLTWSQPMTTAMSSFIPVVDSIGRDTPIPFVALLRGPSFYPGLRAEMLLQGLGARIPLLQNLIAVNWAILCVIYATTVPIILVELRGRAAIVAADIKQAVSRRTKNDDLTLTSFGLWFGTALMNGLLATSWIYGRPRALYYDDSQIPFILLLYAAAYAVTTRWILFNILLLSANCRRLLFPDEVSAAN